VVVGWQTRVAIAFRELFPDWYGEAMALVNQSLPAPTNLEAPAVRGEDLAGTVPNLLNRLVPPSTRPGSA